MVGGALWETVRMSGGYRMAVKRVNEVLGQSKKTKYLEQGRVSLNHVWVTLHMQHFLFILL